MSPIPRPRIRLQGQRDYLEQWQWMRQWTEQRNPDTPDHILLLQHPPVYTLGRNARREHMLHPGGIPVHAVDRGGQVTYHGPGQLIVYPLLNLKRLGLGVRATVMALEQAVIDLLADYHIPAHARREAPGVYVGEAKIAALGLRVRKGCCYHGLALNVAMDLEPFSRIDPCGYPGLSITQLCDLGGPDDPDQVARALLPHLLQHLRYTAGSGPTHLPL